MRVLAAGATCRKPREMVCKLVQSARDVPAVEHMGGPCDAARVAFKLIGEAAQEHFVVLYIGVNGCITSYNSYSTGGLSQVLLDPAAIIRNAILANAAGLVTVHNHPSGEARPSDADVQTWRELDKRAQVVGINHMDDLILGDDHFFSRASGRQLPYDGCLRTMSGGY